MRYTPTLAQKVQVYWACRPVSLREFSSKLSAEIAPDTTPPLDPPHVFLQQKVPLLLILEENQEQLSCEEALELLSLYPHQLSLILLTDGPMPVAERAGWVRRGFRDVIDRHEAATLNWAIQRELLQLKERIPALQPDKPLLNRLFQITPLGIFQCDAHKQCIYVNTRFSQLSGLSFEEAQGDGWLSAVHPEDRQQLVNLWYNQRDKPEIRKGVFRLKNPKTGKTSWVLGQSISELNDAGEVVAYLGTLLDINELKETKEILKNRDLQVEKLNGELDNFVYRASHNLRAPLTTILGLINLLKLDAGNEEQVHQLAELMDQSVKRLDAFVHEIIDYSQNNRLRPECKPINLADMLHNIEEEFSSLYDLRNIRFQYRQHLQAPIYSDEVRLSMILRNLLSNSIRYRKPGEEITDIRITAQCTQETLELKVEDDGLGIALEHQPFIFDMFYRADERRSGAGIGLYITRDAVLRLDGSITLHSEAGEGTQVNIKLPNYRC